MDSDQRISELLEIVRTQTDITPSEYLIGIPESVSNDEQEQSYQTLSAKQTPTKKSKGSTHTNDNQSSEVSEAVVSHEEASTLSTRLMIASKTIPTTKKQTYPLLFLMCFSLSCLIDDLQLLTKV